MPSLRLLMPRQKAPVAEPKLPGPQEREAQQPQAATPENIAALTEAVAEVREQLADIHQVVDQIREDLAWTTRTNGRDEWRPMQPLTSVPLDPLATDWAQRVTRGPPVVTPPSQPSPVHRTPDTKEQVVFCCDRPQLNWEGDPQIATIVCASCGFVLADDGQLGDWHDPEQIAWEQEYLEEERRMQDMIVGECPDPAENDGHPPAAGRAQHELF